MEASANYGPALPEALAPALTERRKWTNDARNVREEDLVLVVDENSPRACWPLGRVCSLEMTKESEQPKFVPRVRPTSDLSLNCVY